MTGLVLGGGPSDHRPHLQAFQYIDFGGGFNAVDYNVEHGHTATDLEKVFKSIEVFKPELWILQEVKSKTIERYLRKKGYATKSGKPEFLIAWNPKRFEFIRSRLVKMSPTEYWTTNYALEVTLLDKHNGAKVKAMSLHPPAHAQAPKDPSFPKVYKVLRQAAAKWNKIAQRWNNKERFHVFVGAGDLNVDTGKGWEPPGGWDFLAERPLQLVEPPDPTRGDRKIDYFLTSGLRAL